MKRTITNTSLPFVLLFLLCTAFYYDGVLDKGPLSIHMWRQSDCLSMTHQYMEGASLFQPEMHIQLGDDSTTGYSAGEFPIMYYVIGNIWKLTGESYMVYRLIYLLIMFFGVFAFYKSIRLIFNSNFWATTLALLLYTSPIYVIYGVSFLTDAPAFSFILIALYFMLHYHLKANYKMFYWALFFIALAGLIKVSSLIPVVFMGLILVIETFKVKTLGERSFYHGLKREWLGYGVALLAIFSWYYYASYYNDLHRFKYTFNDIYPLWNMGGEEFDEWWKGVRDFASYFFFNRSVIFLMLLGFITNLFLVKKVPLFVSLASIVITLGGVLYLILWAPLIRNHDYYYTPVLILLPAIFLPFLWFLKERKSTRFNSKYVKGGMALLVAFNFLYCLQIVKLRSLAETGEHRIVQNADLVMFLKWHNQTINNGWERYEGMRPYLNEIGVKKTDRVISLPDDSFNISLYLMHRKGWTNFSRYSTVEDMEYLKERDARYLIIGDSITMKQDFLQPYMTNQVGSYAGINIYKL